MAECKSNNKYIKSCVLKCVLRETFSTTILHFRLQNFPKAPSLSIHKHTCYLSMWRLRCLKVHKDHIARCARMIVSGTVSLADIHKSFWIAMLKYVKKNCNLSSLKYHLCVCTAFYYFHFATFIRKVVQCYNSTSKALIL